MYSKHAFDSEGVKFKQMYDSEIDVLKHLKAEYKEKYGTPNS
jgi:hypothetical protein